MHILKVLDAKMSKMRLQAKSKIASLTAQLEESKKVATDVLEKVFVGLRDFDKRSMYVSKGDGCIR